MINLKWKPSQLVLTLNQPGSILHEIRMGEYVYQIRLLRRSPLIDFTLIDTKGFKTYVTWFTWLRD